MGGAHPHLDPCPDGALPPSRRVAMMDELARIVTAHASPATLATLARSSKLLHEAAVDRLWYELDSVAPLVDLLTYSSEPLGPPSNVSPKPHPIDQPEHF